MAEPFARLEWRGKPLVCYLQPGCEVSDLDALAGDIGKASTTCCTDPELDAELVAIAERHHLGLSRGLSGVPSDPVERILSFGFLPPVR